MKVSTERIESNQVVLNVEVDPETVEQSLNQAHRRLAQRVNIPGFRRGKAPRAMVERFVGRPALLEEALDRLVPELYAKIIEDEKIDAVAQPKFEVIELEPVTFKATVPVRPEVELGDYGAIRVEVEDTSVSDEEVNEQLENLRERQAVFEPVERPAGLGDQVTIDVTGMRGDEQIIDQENLDYPLIETLQVPVPGFAAELVGLSAGDSKEFEIIPPAPEKADDAENEAESEPSLPIKFRVTVHEVKGKSLPELSDDFAKDLGEEFENLEALRTRIQDNLRQRRLNERASAIEDKVVAAALEQAQLELPPGLVDREIESLAEDQERLLASQRLSIDDYLRITQKSAVDVRADLEEVARKRLSQRFVLDEIAKREELTASDEEVEADLTAAIAAERAQHAGHKHALRNLDRPEIRASLAEVIRRRKALRWLIDNATEGKLKSSEAVAELAANAQSSSSSQETVASAPAEEE